MVIYTFQAHSIEGLLITVEVEAKNYKEAKRKVQKHIYLNTEEVLKETFIDEQW